MTPKRIFQWLDNLGWWLINGVTVAAAGLGAYVAWIILSEMQIGWLVFIGVMIGAAIVSALIVRIAIWVMSIGS